MIHYVLNRGQPQTTSDFNQQLIFLSQSAAGADLMLIFGHGKSLLNKMVHAVVFTRQMRIYLQYVHR